MSKESKYPLLKSKADTRDVLGEIRVPGEKKRIVLDNMICDYKCFKKSKSEKLALKLAKLKCKQDEMKR